MTVRADLPLHRPYLDDAELDAVREVLASGCVQGGGPWTERAERMLRESCGVRHALLTTNCTHALEAAAMGLAIEPGDEVIVPTWEFPVAATAFLRQGARIVFADSRPDDPAVDIDDVVRRVGPRTRVVVIVHYAGQPVDVPALRHALGERGVAIVEDAAQAIHASLNGRACGTMGDAGCLSFHGTKNIVCGEGGALLTDDDALAERVLTIREMGTNRRAFLRGEVDGYSWQRPGSAFLPSELQAAVLCAQLGKAEEILAARRRVVAYYEQGLTDLAEQGRILLPRGLPGGEGNGHVFWVTFASAEERERVRAALAADGIEASRHFHPLDDSPFGRQLTGGAPPLPNAQRFHRGLLRLPVYPQLGEDDCARIVSTVRGALA